MARLKPRDVASYIKNNIGKFHDARLKSLGDITLLRVLTRKNPYLFRAKNILTGDELVRTIFDAFLASQEEAIFGDFLENLAIFVCGKAYGGKKSSAEGIDLEFEKDGVIYIVSIKSGPNWGNSRQIAGMKSDFLKGIHILKTNNPTANVVAVNGCCYGRCTKWQLPGHWKLCGQKFWEFISGDSDLYKDIIEPLGHRAKERNEEFAKLYAQKINAFNREILNDFVTNDLIDWNKLVEYVSAIAAPKRARTPKNKYKRVMEQQSIFSASEEN